MMSRSGEAVGKGSRVYYVGDIKNQPGWGVVSAQYNSEFGEFLDILLDDGRECLGISPTNFSGIGRRFISAAEAAERGV